MHPYYVAPWPPAVNVTVSTYMFPPRPSLRPFIPPRHLSRSLCARNLWLPAVCALSVAASPYCGPPTQWLRRGDGCGPPNVSIVVMGYLLLMLLPSVASPKRSKPSLCRNSHRRTGVDCLISSYSRQLPCASLRMDVGPTSRRGHRAAPAPSILSTCRSLLWLNNALPTRVPSVSTGTPRPSCFACSGGRRSLPAQPGVGTAAAM